MAALDLHHAIFTNENSSDLPLRSASSFLYPAPERDESPTSHLFASGAYQDIVQRQPTHPDGPMSGWDLGLNLLGDPLTIAERKSREEYQTRMKLRRLRATNTVFELLFGIWGTYTTIRYFIAFVDNTKHSEHVWAFALGIMSALVVALVITSMSMPLFPRQGHSPAWHRMRSLLRACYLLLLSAVAVINLVLVASWHPKEICGWDIDISWYNASTSITPCHPASFSGWMAAAIMRLVVTWTMVLSFSYAVHSYHEIRHPVPAWSSLKYLPSDPEEMQRVLPSSPLDLLKSTLNFSRYGDSDHTLNQSSVTLPKSNSISTLAPSTSCTGHSRSQSAPCSKEISPLKISPPIARRASIHVINNEPPAHFQSETAFHTAAAAMEPSPAPHLLRRTSRISVSKVTADTTSSDGSSHLERLETSTRDGSEIRSWRAEHRGASDNRKVTSAWENGCARHGSQAGASTSRESGDSRQDRDEVVCAYGYGACGPTYPYLDMYYPRRRGGYGVTVEVEEDVDLDPHGRRAGQGTRIGPVFPEAASGPSLLMREEEAEEEEGSGEEEEEYVAMMGGFVRRMATIESLGSKEGGTMSTGVARCKTPLSEFSSVRFAVCASSSSSCGTGSATTGKSGDGSFSTAYLSFSSGGTGMWVNERGELLPGRRSDRGTGGSAYYTASLPRTDDGCGREGTERTRERLVGSRDDENGDSNHATE